jgi:hypothetical protein
MRQNPLFATVFGESLMMISSLFRSKGLGTVRETGIPIPEIRKNLLHRSAGYTAETPPTSPRSRNTPAYKNLSTTECPRSTDCDDNEKERVEGFMEGLATSEESRLFKKAQERFEQYVGYGRASLL